MKEIRKYHDVTGINITKKHKCESLEGCQCEDVEIVVTSEFKMTYHTQQKDKTILPGESYQIDLKWFPRSRKWICILKNERGHMGGD